MSEEDDILLEFISESRDLMEEAVPRLIDLQKVSESTGQVDKETLNSIFRAFHSIKGSAGFLQFEQISAVTHVAETLMDLFRKGKRQIVSGHIDILLRVCDFIQAALDAIESSRTDAALSREARMLEEELNGAVNMNPDNEAGEGSVKAAPTTQSDQPESKAAEVEVISEKADEKVSKEEHAVDIDLVIEITDEMRERFIEESDDLLTRTEELLLEINKSPARLGELIPETFRMLHSFKGNCGFMGYGDLEQVSHALETVFDAMRLGQVECSNENIDLFLKVVDILREGLDKISAGEKGRLPGRSGLCDLLNEMVPQAYHAANELPASAEAPADEKPAPNNKPEAQKQQRPTGTDSAGTNTDGKQQNATPLSGVDESAELAPASAQGTPPPPRSKKENKSRPAAKDSGKIKPVKVARRDIRVDLNKLDVLSNLVGELVIAQAMVTGNPDLKGHEFENFERAALHLDRIVRDLQDVTMAVRMVPISGTFRKMIRLVHDLSAKFGKKARLEILGETTEIDKTVAELISDPLVHIIRNAVDHGLETPEERVAAGKEETGTIRLEARHEGGEIWLLIQDDGRGLDREKILAKARDRGMVEGDGNSLTDAQVFQLLFEAGFSTAEQVTDVSGRGVGMDVVKRNIEKLKGQIDTSSIPGKGTSFVLRIPLTVAIIEGMLVRVGRAKYTVPLLAVRECTCLTPEQITKPMRGQEIVKVRDEIIPVIRLYQLHDVTPDTASLEEGVLVILENKEEIVGLFVDEILGQHQTVIKAFPQYMGEVRSVSGCTILGDGDVSLILDPKGLMAMAKRMTIA